MQLLKHFKELTVRPKNAQELKGLILQLAVQGKLTGKWREANPNVESVTNLLKDIKIEKDNLIKEKKVRKSKKSSNVKTEEKYLQLPKTWEWSRIIEIGNLFNGNSVNKEVKELKYEGLEDGYSYLGTKDVNYGFEQLNYDNGVKIPFDEPKFKIAHKNTPLICSEGGSAGKKCGITTKDICFGNKLYALELYGNIEPLLILSLYQTPIFFQEFQNRMTGIIGGISINSFGEIPIAIPPLEEQKAIVEVVETLFKEVEQLEQLTVERISLKEKFVISALNQLTTNNAKNEWTFLQEHFHGFFNETKNIKKLRETILQLAVQGKLTADSRFNNPNIEEVKIDKLEKLRQSYQINDSKIRGQKSFRYQESVKIDVGGKSKGIESLFEIPKSWAWVSLGQIAWSINDGPHFSPNYVDNGIPMISGRNVSFENGIDFTSAKYVSILDHLEFTKRGKPEVGDVLLTKGGTTGIPCVVETTKEFSVWVHVALIKVIREFINPHYLKMALASPFVYRQSQEQTHGIGNKDLGLTRMIFFAIPLPPFEEQHEIVQKVNALMTLCDALEQQVRQSQEQSEKLMQSCLREVFEGKKEIALI